MLSAFFFYLGLDFVYQRCQIQFIVIFSFFLLLTFPHVLDSSTYVEGLSRPLLFIAMERHLLSTWTYLLISYVFVSNFVFKRLSNRISVFSIVYPETRAIVFKRPSRAVLKVKINITFRTLKNGNCFYRSWEQPILKH